jgi:hypothetical protein
VTNFEELEGAVNGDDGDIKLCSGPIIFKRRIELGGRQLKFTCPSSDCVLDAEGWDTQFFHILETSVTSGTSNISFDGITFKNGNGGVSPQ